MTLAAHHSLFVDGELHAAPEFEAELIELVGDGRLVRHIMWVDPE